MTQTSTQFEKISPLAGKPAPREMLVDIGRLDREYYARKPDLDDPTQRAAERFKDQAHLDAILPEGPADGEPYARIMMPQQIQCRDAHAGSGKVSPGAARPA